MPNPELTIEVGIPSPTTLNTFTYSEHLKESLELHKQYRGPYQPMTVHKNQIESPKESSDNISFGLLAIGTALVFLYGFNKFRRHRRK